MPLVPVKTNALKMLPSNFHPKSALKLHGKQILVSSEITNNSSLVILPTSNSKLMLKPDTYHFSKSLPTQPLIKPTLTSKFKSTTVMPPQATTMF